MRTRHVVFSFALLSLVLGLTVSGHAETTQCTAVSSVPTVIDTPGIYCLTADLEFAPTLGTAINIDADDVLLDLNGHTLTGPGGSGTTTVGVSASQHENVRVKNGTIRGFNVGVFLTGSQPLTTVLGYVVEDIRAENNAAGGIAVEGRASLVRHNLVLATGGTGVPLAIGISALGAGVRVIDNDIIRVSHQKGGLSYGIYFCASTANAIALGNRITEADQGIYMAFSTVKYRDNLTTGVALPYVLGTDAGNND